MTFKRELHEDVIQINHGLDYPLSLQVYDYRNRENAVNELQKKANEIQAGIDLERGPLMKLGLFHLTDGHRLLIAIHHLVIDGVSWRILFEDIETLFQQYQKKEELQLPPKTDSFQFWSGKLMQYANSEGFLKEKTYWSQLESTAATDIKKDFPDGTNRKKDAERLSFELNEEETTRLLTRVNQAFSTEINDILLTALGLALEEIYGTLRQVIAIEGHGREEILENIDLSRTVGWFTSLYPLNLDFSYADNLARQIIEVKENLRRIPHKGIGYGILKYLTAPENKKEIRFKLHPRISFNYMGQFDTDVAQRSFKIAPESAGHSVSIHLQRDYELDILSMITNKRLLVTIIYSKNQYKRETIENLLQQYETKLSHIISFCVAQEESEPTPSDFLYKDLSLDQLEHIFDH
jgi:non-ribosomal peptide synthase protein (TIGR01720 family)